MPIKLIPLEYLSIERSLFNGTRGLGTLEVARNACVSSDTAE